MTVADVDQDAPDTAQLVREFRYGIRDHAGVWLNTNSTVVECLFRAIYSHGWTLQQLITECVHAPLGSNVAGVVVHRLKQAADRLPDDPRPPGSDPPPKPHVEPLRKFVQPRPWCGLCDDPRTRWRDTEGGVCRCECWTDPASIPP